MLERQSKYQRRYEMKSTIPSGFVLHKKDPSSLIFFHYPRQFQPGSPFDQIVCIYLLFHAGQKDQLPKQFIRFR